MDYKAAGVNIEAGEETVSRIKTLAQKTFSSKVLTGIGQFGGLFNFDEPGVEQPVLVSSADGVGTKLKIAFMTGQHNTVGQDLVNHCVNDIVVMGARPLFFLDYIATGQLAPQVVEEVVSGLANACQANKCALIGGETAEMPDFYSEGEYDMAGFIVGVVDRGKIIDGSAIKPGDVMLGLGSSGLHTNGYSLARAICFKKAGLSVNDHIPEFGKTLGAELLTPHRSYADSVLAASDTVEIKGLAHITGGGLPGNIIRILPDNCQAVVDRSSWPSSPIFSFLQKQGAISDEEMFRAFNMGIGLVVILAQEQVNPFCKLMDKETVYQIGVIEKGTKEVKIV